MNPNHSNVHVSLTNSCSEEAERAKSAVKVIGRRPVQVSFANRKLSWKQRKQKQSPTAAASGVEPGQGYGTGIILKEEWRPGNEASVTGLIQEVTTSFRRGPFKATHPPISALVSGQSLGI